LGNPLISVVTVVYNDVYTIANTIKSVVAQTYNNIEYLVIDGASTDGTFEVIKQWEESLTLLCQKDKGIYDAMNKGIEAATGQWIIFMNSGDLFVNEKVLENVVEEIEADGENYDAVYGDCILAKGNSGVGVLKKSYDFSFIRQGMPFCHQSVLVKTKLLKARKFDLQYKVAADYQFFLRLYLDGGHCIKQLSFPLSIFNIEGVSMSVRTFEEMYNIVREESNRVGKHIVLFHKARLYKFYITRSVKRMLGIAK
jgi:glycosyltransferase involved in cell wall biosynthesis